MSGMLRINVKVHYYGDDSYKIAGGKEIKNNGRKLVRNEAK